MGVSVVVYRWAEAMFRQYTQVSNSVMSIDGKLLESTEIHEYYMCILNFYWGKYFSLLFFKGMVYELVLFLGLT